jgi:hypothetical protein
MIQARGAPGQITTSEEDQAMTIRELMWVVLAGALAACGGGGSSDPGHVCTGASTTPPDLGADYADNFTGTWSGTLDTTYVNGVLDSRPATLQITRSDTNKLAVLDLCGAGVPALVTSSSSFDTVCFVCPLEPVNCGVFVKTYDGGTGTVDTSMGTVLTVDLHGRASGCAFNNVDFTQTFHDATLVTTLPALAAPEGEVSAYGVAVDRLIGPLAR